MSTSGKLRILGRLQMRIAAVYHVVCPAQAILVSTGDIQGGEGGGATQIGAGQQCIREQEPGVAGCDLCGTEPGGKQQPERQQINRQTQRQSRRRNQKELSPIMSGRCYFQLARIEN